MNDEELKVITIEGDDVDPRRKKTEAFFLSFFSVQQSRLVKSFCFDYHLIRINGYFHHRVCLFNIKKYYFSWLIKLENERRVRPPMIKLYLIDDVGGVDVWPVICSRNNPQSRDAWCSRDSHWTATRM